MTEVERIRKQIAWKEGEPFSEEKVADTQQNLARTGVFRSIDVRPQPANPETQTRNIDVEVAEARRLSLLYGFGYLYAAGADVNRNDVFGIAGLTYRNLFGRMQSASLEVQYAPISTRGYLFARFLEPYAFNSEDPRQRRRFREPPADPGRQRRQLRRLRRVGPPVGQVPAGRPALRVPGAGGRRTRRTSRRSRSSAFPRRPSRSSSPRSARASSTTAATTSSIRTPAGTRRSPASTPFRSLSADARYGKVSGQAAWFKSIFGGVLGASFKMGGIYPYGLGGYDVIPPEDRIPVPIAERFYSGGSSTGRGFATDLAGIPGATVDYNTQAVPKGGSRGHLRRAISRRAQ